MVVVLFTFRAMNSPRALSQHSRDRIATRTSSVLHILGDIVRRVSTGRGLKADFHIPETPLRYSVKIIEWDMKLHLVLGKHVWLLNLEPLKESRVRGRFLACYPKLLLVPSRIE
jgi:hypothetical protein